jgi:hypothetical protein
MEVGLGESTVPVPWFYHSIYHQKTKHALYIAVVTRVYGATAIRAAHATEYLPMSLPRLHHSPRRSCRGKKVVSLETFDLSSGIVACVVWDPFFHTKMGAEVFAKIDEAEAKRRKMAGYDRFCGCGKAWRGCAQRSGACVEYRLSPNHLFISAGHDLQSPLLQVEH